MKLLRNVEIESDNFQLGDVIQFSLKTGEEAEAMAVKKTDEGMIFCFIDCLKDEYSMNTRDTNKGGYEKSNLRKLLNDGILKQFPDELVSMMKPFSNGDKLRIPTEKEIFGENWYGKNEDENIQQWEPMKDRRNRIAFQGSKSNILEWYWLQNVKKDSASYFARVGTFGGCSYYGASYSLGVRPAFQI